MNNLIDAIEAVVKKAGNNDLNTETTTVYYQNKTNPDDKISTIDEVFARDDINPFEFEKVTETITLKEELLEDIYGEGRPDYNNNRIVADFSSIIKKLADTPVTDDDKFRDEKGTAYRKWVAVKDGRNTTCTIEEAFNEMLAVYTKWKRTYNPRK